MNVDAMKISFLGGGNLATALIGGLMATRERAFQVCVVDRNLDKREGLQARYPIAVHASIDAHVVDADVIVLAVKPDEIGPIARVLRGQLSQQVVVSVAAGIRTGTLTQWLGGYERLVWAMPNTPALVGSGLTGLYATPSVDQAERLMVQTLFEAVGATQWLKDEAMMDALTAISGCGPAYAYLLIESLDTAARTLGFDRETAERLAVLTICGAGALLARTGERPARLREKITTPRGVTEQAVNSLYESDLAGVIARATKRAHAKSQAIGAQYGRESQFEQPALAADHREL